MFGQSFREMLEAAGIKVPELPTDEPQTVDEIKSVEHCKKLTSEADDLIGAMLVPAMKKYVADHDGKKIDSLTLLMAVVMFAKTIILKNQNSHPMELPVVGRLGQELQRAELLLAILGGGPANVIGCMLTSLMAYITMHSYRGILTSEEEHTNEANKGTSGETGV